MLLISKICRILIFSFCWNIRSIIFFNVLSSVWKFDKIQFQIPWLLYMTYTCIIEVGGRDSFLEASPFILHSVHDITILPIFILTLLSLRICIIHLVFIPFGKITWWPSCYFFVTNVLRVLAPCNVTLRTIIACI